jgi:hypothetical protein
MRWHSSWVRQRVREKVQHKKKQLLQVVADAMESSTWPRDAPQNQQRGGFLILISLKEH